MTRPHGSITRARDCKCDACSTTASRYQKQYRFERHRGHKHVVDGAPTHRKLQALNAAGHTWKAIGEELGCRSSAVTNILAHQTVKAATEKRVNEVFRRMEMRIPPDTRESRNAKRRAAEKGWPPPLAWEDIEAGVLADQGVSRIKVRTDRFDLAEVEHMLQHGMWNLPLSPLEKAEVLRRWKAKGRSERALCALTGWREGRYSSINPTTTQEAS